MIWQRMSTAPNRPDHGFDEPGPWFWATVQWADGDRSVVQVRREKRGRWWETDNFGPLDEGRGVKLLCWRPKTEADEPFMGDPAELELPRMMQAKDLVTPAVRKDLLFDPPLTKDEAVALANGEAIQRGPVYIGMDFGREQATIGMYDSSIEVSSSHGLCAQRIGRVFRDQAPDRADVVRDSLLYALRHHDGDGILPVNHVSNLMARLGDDILNNVMRIMLGRLKDKHGLRLWKGQS